MTGTRAVAGPRWRGLPAVPELNLRTYVRVNEVPGVWFLTLDTSSPLFVGMGRALYGLRYRLAKMTVVAEANTVHYLSTAGPAAFSATYAPTGTPVPASPGSLESGLIERYRLFAERRGRLITAVVAHDPWLLQPVELELQLNRMAPPGLGFEGEPIVHFSRCTRALISFPRGVGGTFASTSGAYATIRPWAGSSSRQSSGAIPSRTG
jgi:hypothetical protein